MNDPFDSLQDRLARLEAGEPFDAVCADLPEAETGLLKLAAAFRTVPVSARSANAVAAQRQELLRAAKDFRALNTLPRTDELRRIARPARPRWVWPVALAGSFAALFACVLVAASLAGAAWLRRHRPCQTPPELRSKPLTRSTPSSARRAASWKFKWVISHGQRWKPGNRSPPGNESAPDRYPL